MKTIFVAALIVAVFGALGSARPSRDDSKPFEINRAEVTHTHGKGTDVYVDGQARVYQSDNKRHEVYVNGQYGQHLGGPYGNSRPSYGGGVSYTHRF
uniref:Diptericin n=1 Tax=Mayetiola destructor TaxID=39758 RepID=A0SLC2_MAYDE|nr:diptericin [Mayetiola destructor]